MKATAVDKNSKVRVQRIKKDLKAYTTTIKSSKESTKNGGKNK